jgi:hypothetical protein
VSDSRIVVPAVAKRTFDSIGETASECGFAQSGRGGAVFASGIQFPPLIERKCPEGVHMSMIDEDGATTEVAVAV